MRRLSLAPLALLLALLPLAACETSIMIDPPPFEEALVVYAFPSPDSSWSVAVGKTLPLGTVRDYQVRNATVVVREGESVVETLVLQTAGPDGQPAYSNQPSTYVSTSGATPEAGRTYRIEVSAPGLPSVSAETTIPLAPEAEIVSDEWTFYDEQGFNNSRKVRLALTDLPGDDIYEMALLLQDRYEGPECVPTGGCLFEYTYRFTSVAPSFRDGYDLLDVDVGVETDAEFYGSVVFRDALFPGQRKTFDLSFDTFVDEFATATRTFALLVGRVSEPFARYQSSRSQQNNNEGNPFAEPTPLYSNVEGGHGVVGSFAFVRLALPPPPPPTLAAR